MSLFMLVFFHFQFFFTLFCICKLLTTTATLYHYPHTDTYGHWGDFLFVVVCVCEMHLSCKNWEKGKKEKCNCIMFSYHAKQLCITIVSKEHLYVWVVMMEIKAGTYIHLQTIVTIVTVVTVVSFVKSACVCWRVRLYVWEWVCVFYKVKTLTMMKL